jgi:hypothetical protein
MAQSELLKKVVAALDATGTPYMLTGSYASSLQGQPRSTHDIDLVVAITPIAAQTLLRAFAAPQYYLDELAVSEAINKKSQFNLIENDTGDKVDFWLLTNEPFDQSRFSRRYLQEFQGERFYVSSPEDTLLMKLHWAVMSGGSEKQFNDAKSIFELQSDLLDLSYIESWVKLLDVASLWERIMREAQSD